ncbi:phage major tail tube protein [Anaerotruncus massiliensis (ex Togo et al. 2019)]|uniref:phage major tail tube protein n=1 Tax=Anaerotruncus TaxID=244127 RepID=UPI000C75BEDD|nr:phage major tail tube protein [Anaerotruncus massiliensis (ex Togo et al. 2019)]
MSKVITGAVGAMNILAGGREIGDATSVTLPDIERPTTEIKGAGIMGTFAMPISGQVNAMTASVAVRAANADKRYLVGNNVDLEIRFAFDCRASDGTLFVAGTKIFLRGHTTKIGSGKAEPGSTRDETYDYSVVRYREVVDGEETLLVDQIAGRFVVGGKDLMGGVSRIIK